VILPDVNLLLYAYHDHYPQHAAARDWWEGVLNGAEPVALPWAVILGFARILTNGKIFPEPTSMPQVADILRSWLKRPHVMIIEPTSGHIDLIEELVAAAGTAGSLVTDIHLAALAIEHGAELHSNDSDFSRFPGLRWKNPLGR